MSGDPETFLVFAGMRNEGPFIVEWVSWYRALGFRVLIGVNDCTDHSPALLQRLAEEGWLDWFEHDPPPRVPPKASAHARMAEHPAYAATDWLLICDVDEFLVLHRGDGTIGGFLDEMGRDWLGMAFHWRNFGTSGHRRYEDGLVHRQFTRCGAADMGPNIMFKTLVRQPQRVRRFSDHGPAAIRGTWGQDGMDIVDCEGRVIDRFRTGPHPVRYTDVPGITHRTAQMNHYVIRSDESFDLKRGRPSASAFKDRYTDQFYRARNRNGRKDLSALAHADRFDPVHAAAMALPGVRRLHHLCCADYVATLCANQGLRPEDDPRWHHHKAEADRAG